MRARDHGSKREACRLRRSHSLLPVRAFIQAFLRRSHVALGGANVLVARRFPYFVNLTALVNQEAYELVSEIVPCQTALAADRQARMTEELAPTLVDAR